MPSIGDRIGRELTSTGIAAFDFAVAFASLAFVLGLPVVALNAVAGGPLSPTAVRVAVAVLAFGGSYPFVADPALLDDLWNLLTTLLVSLVGLAIVAAVPFVLAGGAPTDSRVVLGSQAAVVGGAYAIAACDAYRYRRRRGDDTDPA